MSFLKSGGTARSRANSAANAAAAARPTKTAPPAQTAPTASPPSAAHTSGESNIFVAVRVRPKTSGELSRHAGHTVELLNDATTLIFDPSEADAANTTLQQGSGPVHRAKNQAFCFDCVLGPEASQEHVYANTAKEVIPSLLDGFNASVFAYGQTSAGKTFTMLGDRLKGEGVMVRALKDLFDAISQKQQAHATALDQGGTRADEYQLVFSYVEVYNEMIRDLLASDPAASAKELELRDAPDGDVQVLGVSEHKPHNVADVMALLERGNSFRSQSATDANETSSRSHAILQVHLRRTTRRMLNGKMQTRIQRSKLSMIDLAGSERAKATVGREKELRKEGQNINKSLLALGNCINALSSGSTHVPFRDSKLTRLLKDSLGGNCRTIMIANVSPCPSNYEDTYSTLNYAKRAKNIRVSLSKAQLAIATSSDNFNLAQIEALREENERLRQMLRTSKSASETGASAGAPSTVAPTSKLVSGPAVPVEAVEAARSIEAEAEALFARKLQLHRRAFGAWVQGQWARLKGEQLRHELEECHDNVRLDSLRVALDAALAQQTSHSFELEALRRQMVAVEGEISALRDDEGAAWCAFRGTANPAVAEMRRTAQLQVELHEGHCEAEMMRRECNVLRAMVERGWELDDAQTQPGEAASFATMTSPQMTTGTPIWKKLTRGSPGLRMPLRAHEPGPQRRRLQLDPEQSPVKAFVLAPPPAAVEAKAALRSSASSRFDSPVAAQEENEGAVAEPQMQPPRAVVSVPPSKQVTGIAYSFYADSPPRSPSTYEDRISMLPSTNESVPTLTYADQDELGVSSVLQSIDAPAPPHAASADVVPGYVRSFGSSLGLLGTALLSDPPSTSTSFNTSTSSGTSVGSGVSATAAAAAPVEMPAIRKSSVRERLQRMVQQRKATLREEQQAPAVTIDELAYSPVEAANATTNQTSTSPAMMGAQFSFAVAPPGTDTTPVKAVGMTTRSSMIPKPRGKSTLAVDTENRVNATTGTSIPRPGSSGGSKKKKPALAQVK